MNKIKLVLASKSPRRKEFFDWLDLPYTIKTVHIEEKSLKTSPRDIVEDLAWQKGSAVLNILTEDSLVVSADTIVTLDGKIFGKPESTSEAKKILLELAGKTHQVITAVYLGSGLKEKVFSDQTDVSFGEIPADLLEIYLASKDSLDKAGAYGIQGMAQSFITSIHGNYSNVVGLPMPQLIQEMGIFFNNKCWRSYFV